MNVIMTAEAPWSGAAAVPDHRPRLGMGEKTIVPDGVVLAQRATTTPEKHKERRRSHPGIEPETENETVFAASVIAGTLPALPPQSHEDLVHRLEGAPPPGETESLLRDRFA